MYSSTTKGVYKIIVSTSVEIQRIRYLSGWGVDFSRLRSQGSSIAGRPNASSGKVPFLKVANDLLVAIDQAG